MDIWHREKNGGRRTLARVFRWPPGEGLTGSRAHGLTRSGGLTPHDLTGSRAHASRPHASRLTPHASRPHDLTTSRPHDLTTSRPHRLQAPGSRLQAPGSRLQAPGSRAHGLAGLVKCFDTLTGRPAAARGHRNTTGGGVSPHRNTPCGGVRVRVFTGPPSGPRRAAPASNGPSSSSPCAHRSSKPSFRISSPSTNSTTIPSRLSFRFTVTTTSSPGFLRLQ